MNSVSRRTVVGGVWFLLGASVMSSQTVTELVDIVGDGTGNPLFDPTGVAADAAGNVFVAGANSHNLLVIETSAQGWIRNGSGIKPMGFSELTQAVLGTNWVTSVDIATPGAAASAVGVFLGGPLPGLTLGIGELLRNFPQERIDIAVGSHTILIPNEPTLLGRTVCTQAATLDFGPLQIQLQNAIDISFGTY